MRSWRTDLIVGALLTCCFGVGCGGSSVPGPKWPDPVPVTGKITYKGKPFANGTVMFIPDLATIGQGGSGQTDEGGEYSVQTRWSDQTMKDGLIPGKYKVAFSRLVKPDGTVWVAPPNSTEGPASSGAREEMPLNVSSPAETKYVHEVGKSESKFDAEIQ